MNPDIWQAVSAIGAAVAAIASVIAVIIASAQVKAANRQIQQGVEATQSQLDAARNLAQTQNAFALVEYLERPDNLEARRGVASLAGKPYAEWTNDEKRTADLVTRIWETAAGFEYLGCLPPGYLRSVYGGVISRQWRILQPQVAVIREQSGDPRQRHQFEEFAQAQA